MWQCAKCLENLEDTFDVCWHCGTSQDGAEDPDFPKADDVSAASNLEAMTDEDATIGQQESQPGKGFESVMLTVGQLISLLGCIGTPFFAFAALDAEARRQRAAWGPDISLWWTIGIIIGAAMAFCYSAAMFVVFSRVKQLPRA